MADPEGGRFGGVVARSGILLVVDMALIVATSRIMELTGLGDSGRTRRAATRLLSVSRNLMVVKTRTLIILSLICGLALVVAFAIQAVQIL